MEWNVYIYNINKDIIELYNIFEHWSFVEYVKKHIKKYKNKDEFTEKLRSELRYYFWSKCEWELIIEITDDSNIFLSAWIGRQQDRAIIDVTDDTTFDWKGFAEKHISKQIYNNKAKIDVFDQVMWRWNEFVDFVWDNKKEILKIE